MINEFSCNLIGLQDSCSELQVACWQFTRPFLLKRRGWLARLMQHYHGHLNNPIIMARMLLLEGVFDEHDWNEVTHKTSISGQIGAFNKALEKAVDDYDKLVIFAVILLKYKTTVHIGKILLKECVKLYSLVYTVLTSIYIVNTQ